VGGRADSHGGEDSFTVHRGDARDFGQTFDRLVGPAVEITTTVTSPPYFDLIDYGRQPNQIGHGQRYDEYLSDCRAVFKQVFDRTAMSGSLWIIADTFLDQTESPSRLRNLPFDLAAQCESIGWVLRDVIIWHKDKTRPWSQPGRLRNTFEYVLYFVRSANFKYNVDAIREPAELAQWWVKYPERYNPRGRAPDNVWRYAIPSQGSWANSSVRHACPLPPQLIDRIIRLSTDAGDVVCDPFAGSGTVVAEAERLSRKGFGTELNPTYIQAYETTVRSDLLTRAGDPEVDALQKKSDILSIAIKKLRALKLARASWTSYVKQHPELPVPTHVIALSSPLVSPTRAHLHQDVSLAFVCDGTRGELDEVQRCLKEITGLPPLTKYGISGDIRVVSIDEVRDDATLCAAPLWLYQHGRTWRTDGATTLEGLLATPRSSRRMAYPPIASNIEISLSPDAASGELGQTRG
jgi:DNA modification methylase